MSRAAIPLPAPLGIGWGVLCVPRGGAEPGPEPGGDHVSQLAAGASSPPCPQSTAHTVWRKAFL